MALTAGQFLEDLRGGGGEAIEYPLHSEVELLKFVVDHLEECLKMSSVVSDC